MDLFETIRKRRSVRNYTGEPIPRAHLEQIVEAARWAPSGYNKQPWEFVVVTRREVIEQLAAAANWMDKAGAIVAVVIDPTAKFWIEDGSAAIVNMLLAATALGYGSCWLEGYTLRMEDELKRLLNIPDSRRLLSLVPLGVPVEWPEQTKKSLDEVLRWETY